VLSDVLDGYVSERTARDQYRVLINNGAVDEQGTARLRAQRTKAAPVESLVPSGELE
jgi:hypothetical protein